MADVLLPTHPLEGHRVAFAALSAELAGSSLDLAVELLPSTGALDLRLDPTQVRAPDVVGTLGALPTSPNTWTAVRDARACWLGPDEWLLVGEGLPGEEDLRAVGVAAVDVSSQRTGIQLRGPGARTLLAHDCALDLRPASFPPGRCAQTLLGQVGVLLVADAEHIDVHVRSSFAGYAADLLLDAAQEYRTHPLGPDQEKEEP